MTLINCEVSLTLTWSDNYVFTDITTQAARNANSNADPPVHTRERIDAPTSSTDANTAKHKVVRSSCYFIYRKW